MSVQNSLAPKQNSGGGKLSVFLNQDSIKNWINSMVGSENGQRFITQLLSATVVNPSLATCDQTSLVSAALVGESLKLSPSPQLGQFYMVPFKDNKLGRVVATPVIGWKGYVQLAIRSGQYKRLNVLAIKEGELKRFDPLTEEVAVELIEDDSVRENAKTIGYFATFEYLNGFRKTMYWSRKKMEEHALRYSKAYGADKKYNSQKSFWSTDFDSQGLKTMIRQILSRWGMMSIEIQKALESDSFAAENEFAVTGGDNSHPKLEGTPPMQADSNDDPFADDGAIDAEFKLTNGEPDSEQTPIADALSDEIRKATAKGTFDRIRREIGAGKKDGSISVDDAEILTQALNERVEHVRGGGK